MLAEACQTRGFSLCLYYSVADMHHPNYPNAGRSYELPVQYARDGNRVWILPWPPEHKTWWRNLRDGAEVDLTLAGRCLHGHGVVLDQTREPELAEGVAAYLRGFPHARRALGAIRPTSAEPTIPAPHCTDQGTVLVRIDLDHATD